VIVGIIPFGGRQNKPKGTGNGLKAELFDKGLI
jgi:hypothetical protein